MFPVTKSYRVPKSSLPEANRTPDAKCLSFQIRRAFCRKLKMSFRTKEEFDAKNASAVFPAVFRVPPLFARFESRDSFSDFANRQNAQEKFRFILRVNSFENSFARQFLFRLGNRAGVEQKFHSNDISRGKSSCRFKYEITLSNGLFCKNSTRLSFSPFALCQSAIETATAISVSFQRIICGSLFSARRINPLRLFFASLTVCNGFLASRNSFYSPLAM